MARIKPLSPPYPAETQKLFDLVMPKGMDPLVLFRTLATNTRIFPRFMRAGVLDKGPVGIRDRELVIHRTTARCGAEYEWGVHVAAFARPLGMGDDWVHATVHAGPDDPIWTPAQAALVRLCDELHETQTISDGLWEELQQHFSEEQTLELIYTAGMYHAVSFLVNGLRLENELFGERFPERRSSQQENLSPTPG
jgi:alkylhydroperoxidase family enzyme